MSKPIEESTERFWGSKNVSLTSSWQISSVWLSLGNEFPDRSIIALFLSSSNLFLKYTSDEVFLALLSISKMVKNGIRSFVTDSRCSANELTQLQVEFRQTDYKNVNTSVCLNLTAARKINSSCLLMVHKIYSVSILASHNEGRHCTISNCNLWFKEGFYW